MSDLMGIKSTDPMVGNHVKKYRLALESGQSVQVSSLLDSYRQMSPSLHQKLMDSSLDIDAINYAATRLPLDIFRIKKVFLGQSLSIFQQHGFDISSWKKVTANNRRRLMYWNQDENILACIINSDSDIDDIVNSLIAYQIEHAKLAQILHGHPEEFLMQPDSTKIGIPLDVGVFFSTMFGADWGEYVLSTRNPLDFEIQLLPKTVDVYKENCQNWWKDVSSRTFIFGLNKIPVYFVSSNSHSLVNIIGGFLNHKQSYIFDYISQNQPLLFQQWFESKRRNNLTQVNDFIYYVANNFLRDNPSFISEKSIYESGLGINTVKSSDLFPTDVQIIPVSSMVKSLQPDVNLKIADPNIISQSKALIVNIQYPLGIAANYLLTQILNYFEQLKGIYIIGKAAILNGNIGDIQIPTTVFDEVTSNIYQFNNLFNNYFPFSSYISNVLTDQKAVCVYGTFLENRPQMENYAQTNFNIIEMENGNYLAAIMEHYKLSGQSVGSGQIHQVTDLPVDLGIINYASDNPLSQNLGQEAISFRGIESTYLASLATLQRIIDLESGVK